jgi:hypothetical protein
LPQVSAGEVAVPFLAPADAFSFGTGGDANSLGSGPLLVQNGFQVRHFIGGAPKAQFNDATCQQTLPARSLGFPPPFLG